MLHAEHITCGYGGDPVVRDLSFSAQSGQILCILGANGCGKTTLLRAVAGLLPSTGSVTAAGLDLRTAPRRQVAQTVAFLSQLSNLYFSYTVYQTVEMGRYAHRSPGLFGRAAPGDKDIVRSCLEQTGLWELRDQPITALSGGQLQRVFLARVFAQDPKIILLDEPTNHLDLKYQIELMEQLRRWVAQGNRCVVGVLHDVNLALNYADQLLLMQDGRALCQTDTQALDPALLDRIYGLDVRGYMRRALQRWE